MRGRTDYNDDYKKLAVVDLFVRTRVRLYAAEAGKGEKRENVHVTYYVY